MPGARGARVFLALLAIAGCHRAQPPAKTTSRWVYPLPQGNHLSSVWVAKSGDVYAVGDGGNPRPLRKRSTSAGQPRSLPTPHSSRLSGATTRAASWPGGRGRHVAFVARGGGSLGFQLGCRAGAARPPKRRVARRRRDPRDRTDGQFTRSEDGGAHWRAGRVPGAPPPRADSWPRAAPGDLTRRRLRRRRQGDRDRERRCAVDLARSRRDLEAA